MYRGRMVDYCVVIQSHIVPSCIVHKGFCFCQSEAAQSFTALQKLLAMLGDMARGDPEQATHITVHWILFSDISDLGLICPRILEPKQQGKSTEGNRDGRVLEHHIGNRAVAPGLSWVNFRNNLHIPGRSFSCSVGRVWSAMGRGDPCEDRKGFASWNMGSHGNSSAGLSGLIGA